MQVNGNMLRGKIIERGMSSAEMADAMGINLATFYRKIKSPDKMLIRDASKIVEILGLTGEEAINIFLAK